MRNGQHRVLCSSLLVDFICWRLVRLFKQVTIFLNGNWKGTRLLHYIPIFVRRGHHKCLSGPKWSPLDFFVDCRYYLNKGLKLLSGALTLMVTHLGSIAVSLVRSFDVLKYWVGNWEPRRELWTNRVFFVRRISDHSGITFESEVFRLKWFLLASSVMSLANFCDVYLWGVMKGERERPLHQLLSRYSVACLHWPICEVGWLCIER